MVCRRGLQRRHTDEAVARVRHEQFTTVGCHTTDDGAFQLRIMQVHGEVNRSRSEVRRCGIQLDHAINVRDEQMTGVAGDSALRRLRRTDR